MRDGVFGCLLGRCPATKREKNTAREKNADSKPTSAKGPQRPQEQVEVARIEE